MPKKTTYYLLHRDTRFFATEGKDKKDNGPCEDMIDISVYLPYCML
jgi:hypothetical protein